MERRGRTASDGDVEDLPVYTTVMFEFEFFDVDTGIQQRRSSPKRFQSIAGGPNHPKTSV